MSTTRQPTAQAPEWASTACILCECNCGLEVALNGRSLAKIRGDKAHPGSAGYTCEKPLRLDRYQNGPHRIASPMRRRADGGYDEIDWDTALNEIADRLRAIRDEHGGESIFYYGGGGQGNHLGGSYGRSMLAALGARYMSNALAQEKAGEAWVDEQLYGNHTSGDFENTEVAIFIGKNPWQSHGIERARPTLREIARDPDRAMIVIDPRRSETAEIADYHLQVKPGTDAWCVSALVATIVQEDLYAAEWLAAHATGTDEVLEVLRSVDIATNAVRCGVDEELIRSAARRIARAKSAATYEDLGIQQSPNSTVVSYLNKMIWILTGNFAKPGGVHIHSWVVPIAGRWHPIPPASARPLKGARRAVGIGAMRWGAGALRRTFAWSQRSGIGAPLADIAARGGLEAFFDAVAVPSARRIAVELGRSDITGRTPVSGARIQYGLTPASAIADEILTDHPRRLRAMWIDASNPAHSLPESARFVEALEALDLSVVIDVAMTETARHADYVLPAASQFEKFEASLFTLHFPHNTFQIRRPLMAPLEGTRPEAQIYAEIIDRLDVVDQGLLDDLTAAARISRSAFGLALFSAIERRPELAGLTPYLLYRTLGAVLPEGEQALALAWGYAHLCAIAQPDAVARAGFTARGFARGEQLFEAFLAHPSGVQFSDDAYDDAWSYIQHDDGRIHLHIPELLDEVRRLQGIDPAYTSDDYPLILSAGERRAFTANVIIRNPEWRRRDPEGALRVSEKDAVDLGIETGDVVRIVTAGGAATTPVEVSEMMQEGHISLPNGLGVSYPAEDGGESIIGVALNELTTNNRRDAFFGTPWHKNVPARIEVIPMTGGQ